VPGSGIGAGPATDGQVLVFHDLLGIYQGRSPKFVRRYAEVYPAMVDGVRRYAADVRGRRFPADEHVYPIDPGEVAEFRAYLDQDSLIGTSSWDW
jgi:3-methyl-2-oxobutanoate hydroxymethyltransferase